MLIIVKFLLLFVFSIPLLTACVSKSKYQMLEESFSSQRAGMEEEISELEAQNKNLEKEIEQKKIEIRELNGRVIQMDRKATEIKTQKEAEIDRLKGTYESLVTDLKTEIEKGEIKVTQIQNTLSVNLVEKILFDSGRAEIKQKGKEILEKVGNILQTVKDKEIRIEGHTDNVPIGGSLRERFPTNWELSTQRASNVLRFLQENAGVDGKYLSAIGYGEFRPIASNETPEGRSENRRIEIVLVPLDIQGIFEEMK